MCQVALESWQWIHQVAAPYSVIRGSGMTCHWIRPNVRHIGILHFLNFFLKNFLFFENQHCRKFFLRFLFKEPIIEPLKSKMAQIRHLENRHFQCLPLPRKRSPDGASPDWGCVYLIAAYNSFIYPERMKGWVGLVGWLHTEIVWLPEDGHPCRY